MERRKVTGFANMNKRTLGGNESARRAYTLASGKVVYGIHTVTLHRELKEKISVHPLNPRIQEDLSFDACSDIAPKIEHEGVLENAVTIFNESTGRCEVIEGSRRLWCADKYEKDFPHWKITADISDEDIAALISSFEIKKPISYRERGIKYPAIMAENNLKTVDELAAFLNRKKETTRKLLQAATIDPLLIHAFPDCNGIPNTFYAKLAKVEKDVNKNKVDLAEFIKEALSRVTTDNEAPLANRQKAVMDSLEELREEKFDADKAKTVSRDIVTFEDKRKAAIIQTSPDKRTTTFVLKRLAPSLIEEIEQLIKSKTEQS